MKFFLLIFLAISFLNAEEKIALLIGNTDYKFQPLSNPVNDVRAIKKTLVEIGFKKKNVMVLENASREKMIDSLLKFQKKAKKANIALVYFSGHGIQVKNNNYLLPANTTATTILELEGLVKLNSILDSVGVAEYGVILIDACRTNPLVNNFTKGKKGSNTTKGLGQVKTKRKKTIISIATQAGKTANDGVGNNSPYAKALIVNLKLNLDIRNVLDQISLDVSDATNNEQIPTFESSLGKYDLCLTGGCKNDYSDEVRRLEEENKRLKKTIIHQKEKHPTQHSSKPKKIIIKGNYNGDINMNGRDVINKTYQ